MQIAPPHVLLARALTNRGIWRARIVAHERPSEQSSDHIADRPPQGHESDKPSETGRQEFDKVGSIENVISSSSC